MCPGLEVLNLFDEINENEIDEIVFQFKKYITLIVSNSAKNYASKLRIRLSREIEFEDYIIEKVSLSNMDNDAFFYDDFKFEYLIDENLIKSSKKLTKKEKTVLEDLINEIPLYVTAKKLNTSLNSISVLRNKARNKLKKDLGGNKYGR